MLLSPVLCGVVSLPCCCRPTATPTPVPGRTAPPSVSAPSITGGAPAFFLAGDSTTAPQAANGGGWGAGFLAALRPPAWGLNRGHNGMTTASFVGRGDWARVLADVRNATRMGAGAAGEAYVTIQFGHNDQKESNNVTVGQFQANLEHMVGDVKAAGGTPVLVTPLCRRSFTSKHQLKDDLADMRAAVLRAVSSTGAHSIDLGAACLRYVAAIGEAAARKYDLKDGDHTHLNARGSEVFGRMVVDLLVAEMDGKEMATGPGGESLQKWWFVANDTLSAEINAGRPAR